MNIKKLSNYDFYIVAFSGGKDSLACVLHLIALGIPKEKIELWHHCVDGKEGSTLMDWPVTEDYCQKVADALGIKLYFSWKQGGFEGEMLRKNELTKPAFFEYPHSEENTIKTGKPSSRPGVYVAYAGGKHGKKNTRMKFPQVSMDLRVRWCSAYLKIDVFSKALTNQPRFKNKRTLVLTGERAEESSSPDKGRAAYAEFEPHPCDTARRENNRTNRHVDQWRAVHKWDEKKVWDIIEQFGIVPHPAYYLSWSRLSCMTCIFGQKDQWASAREVAPKMVEAIADYEKSFKVVENGEVTFKGSIHRSLYVDELADKGEVSDSITPDLKKLAMSHQYTRNIVTSNWELPSGAYKKSVGPS